MYTTRESGPYNVYGFIEVCVRERLWRRPHCTDTNLQDSYSPHILDYAAVVLDGSGSRVVESLECVQNTALRIATGALCTYLPSAILAYWDSHCVPLDPSKGADTTVSDEGKWGHSSPMPEYRYRWWKSACDPRTDWEISQACFWISTTSL